MNTKRGAHGLAVLAGVVYNFGGLTYNAKNDGCTPSTPQISPQSCVTYLNSIEYYDPVNARWVLYTIAPLLAPDFWFAYATLPGP